MDAGYCGCRLWKGRFVQLVGTGFAMSDWRLFCPGLKALPRSLDDCFVEYSCLLVCLLRTILERRKMEGKVQRRGFFIFASHGENLSLCQLSKHEQCV